MEMLQFMQEYIKIDTSHPLPNYRKGFLLFERQVRKDGFDMSILKLESGLEVMIISWKGDDSTFPSFLLNHHTDVVPVQEERWHYPPFEGIIHDNILYGRGTQDMKGVGVCHYFALRKLKKSGIKLQRSVHLILLPHEEVGGFAGGGFFVNTKEFRQLNIGYVLDEGIPSGNDKLLFVKISERKPMQISFISTGFMCHGSRLAAKNAIHELALFLSKVADFQEGQLEKTKDTAAGLLLSMNATSFRAGVIKNDNVALNIIPADAEATIDVRVPPDMHKREALEKIHEMMKPFPSITYEIKTQASELKFDKNYKTDFYNLLAKSIEQQNITVKPYYAEESSDIRFYLEKGVLGLGLTPFTIKENLHGTDEAVKVSDLQLGEDIFYGFIKSFCT